MEIIGDVCEVRSIKKKLGILLITWPCTDNSGLHVNEGPGQEGEHGKLVFSALKHVEATPEVQRPVLVILENVVNIINKDGERGPKSIINKLHQLGYPTIAWRVIAELKGYRRRILFVASNGELDPRALLFGHEDVTVSTFPSATVPVQEAHGGEAGEDDHYFVQISRGEKAAAKNKPLCMAAQQAFDYAMVRGQEVKKVTWETACAVQNASDQVETVVREEIGSERKQWLAVLNGVGRGTAEVLPRRLNKVEGLLYDESTPIVPIASEAYGKQSSAESGRLRTAGWSHKGKES